jgi:hypothetical protein
MTVLAALPLWRARGPRFLMLLLLSWGLVRGAAYWLVAKDGPLQRPAWEPYVQLTPAAPPAVLADAVAANRPRLSLLTAPPQRRSSAQVVGTMLSAALHPDDPLGPNKAGPSVWSSPTRHRWHVARADKWLMSQRPLSRAVIAIAQPLAALQRQFPAGQDTPPTPPPLWPTRGGERWSLDAYSYWRGGTGSAPLGTARAPGLGGSQSAVRIDYMLGSRSRTRLFARLTGSPIGGVQADVAFGAAFRPLAGIPVDLMAEHRLPLAGGGNSATLVYAAGGVSHVALPLNLQLSAYGQGGVAVRGQATARVQTFADAALSVERPLARIGDLHISAGVMAAAAAQPGVRRVDVGPRVTLQLDDVGKGARLSLDWRARVAGNARPESGLALTLSSGF